MHTRSILLETLRMRRFTGCFGVFGYACGRVGLCVVTLRAGWDQYGLVCMYLLDVQAIKL